MSLGWRELVRLVECSPFLEGQHAVTIVVLEAVGVETLVIANVGETALAQRADVIVFLVETVGITKSLVAGGEIAGGYAWSQEGTTVESLVDRDTGQVQNGGAKVYEAYEPVESAAGLLVDEMAEIGGNAYHQGDVESTLVSVPLAAGKDSAMITEVKYEGVLEKAVGGELAKHSFDLLVDDSHAVEISGVSVTKRFRVGMVGGERDFFRRDRGGCFQL